MIFLRFFREHQGFNRGSSVLFLRDHLEIIIICLLARSVFWGFKFARIGLMRRCIFFEAQLLLGFFWLNFVASDV